MVLHVVRASFIGCYVYCVACTSFFKAVWILVLFHSHSFLQFYPNIAATLQTFVWRCLECVIHHEWDVREEQYPYKCGVSREQAIIK